MPTALISTSETKGLYSLVRSLRAKGWNLIATAGTAAVIRKWNLRVTSIEEFTHYESPLPHSLKTLHPTIFEALLCPKKTRKEHGIVGVDLLIVNFYQKALDVGGPAMVAAAIKNYATVAVLTRTEHYRWAQEYIKTDREFSLIDRRRLAQIALREIITHRIHCLNMFEGSLGSRELPEVIFMAYQKTEDVRYGENAHQQGAAYVPIASNLNPE